MFFFITSVEKSICSCIIDVMAFSFSSHLAAERNDEKGVRVVFSVGVVFEGVRVFRFPEYKYY